METSEANEIRIVLSESERNVLASLVRVAIRKRERSLAQGAVTFAGQWDPTRVQARIDLLVGLYQRLGKDPDRITGRM